MVERDSAYGLRVIIAVSTGALILAMAIVLSLVVSNRAEHRLEGEIGHSLSEAAAQMAARLDADMAARARQARALTSVSVLRDWDAARAVTRELKRADPSLAWVGVLDAEGTVRASSDDVLLGVNIAARPVFAEGRKGLYIGDVHDAVMLARLLPNPTGEAMKFVDVAAPIRDGKGEVTGVLATHFSWGWARELRRNHFRPMLDRRGAETLVIGADGVVLLGPEAELGRRVDAPSVTAADADGIGWSLEDWPDGTRYLVGYARMSGDADHTGLGWVTLARQPVAEAFAGIGEMRREMVSWGVGFAALFSVLGWFAAGRITRPLRAIATAARRMRAGEPGVEIPDVAGAGEIGELSRALRALVESLTATRDALSKMEDAAYQDRLTGLPNRRFFDRYVESLINRPGATPLTLMCLDLDGFKPVNDTMGHQVGDTVLHQIGVRLGSCLRDDDVVARLGGDEFVAVVTTNPGKKPPAPEEIARRLINAIKEPVLVAGRAVRVGCSVGVARWPDHGETIDAVMARADEALYAAKRAGRDRVVEYGDGDGDETGEKARSRMERSGAD